MLGRPPRAQLSAEGADQLWAEAGLDHDCADSKGAWYCEGGAGATVVGPEVGTGSGCSGDAGLGAVAAVTGLGHAVALALLLGLAVPPVSVCSLSEPLGLAEVVGVALGAPLGEDTSMAGPRS